MGGPAVPPDQMSPRTRGPRTRCPPRTRGPRTKCPLPGQDVPPLLSTSPTFPAMRSQVQSLRTRLASFSKVSRVHSRRGWHAAMLCFYRYQVEVQSTDQLYIFLLYVMRSLRTRLASFHEYTRAEDGMQPYCASTDIKLKSSQPINFIYFYCT